MLIFLLEFYLKILHQVIVYYLLLKAVRRIEFLSHMVVDDLYGAMPQLGWDRLIKTFFN